MLLKEIMTKDVELLDHDATLAEAALLMKERNVGAIPIRKNDRLAGMITDRDIVVKAIALDLDPKIEKVNSIMSSPIIYCYEDQDVEDAADLMEEKGIRRLPVLNREKRLTGFVSIADMACEAHNLDLAGHVLGAVSAPSVYRM